MSLPISRLLALGTLASILAFTPRGHAAEPPPAPEKGEDIEKAINADAASCRALCFDDNGITLFGGVITVPFVRPSVEQCGIWMSSTPAERAADSGARRREADAEAAKQRYSPREKEELRKRVTEPMKKCESDFRRRCAEVKGSMALADRVKAVEIVKRGVAGLLEAKKKTAAELYLKNLLAECSFGE